MKFTEKLSAAAGAVSVAAAPAVADAAVVQHVNTVSLNLFDIAIGGSAVTPWDIDGDGTPDLFLGGVRATFNTASGGSAVSGTYALFGIGAGAPFVANINPALATGNGVIATSTSYPGIGHFHNSDQLLTAALNYGYTFVTEAVAHLHNAGTVTTTGNNTYTFSSGYGAGSLAIGPNVIGFQFDIAGNIHYGFATLALLPGPNPGIEITSWAYEDQADTDIHITPVPSSGVAALTMLAMGAAGVRGWRKRKTAEAA